MKLKLAVLSGVSALAMSSAASAADLPMVAEPVNYVKACDAFGNGFFQLPGTDTCMSLGGQVRVQIMSGNLMDNDDDEDATDYSAYGRGRIWLDTMTAADFGTIATYAGFYYSWNQDAKGDPRSDDAYVQLNLNSGVDMTFGYTSSIYSGFTGYAWMAPGGADWSDNGALLAALKVPVGPLTFGVSVEDASYTSGGDKVNAIGSLEFDQGMFSFKVSGAYVDNAELDFTLQEAVDRKPTFDDDGEFVNWSPAIAEEKLTGEVDAGYAVNANTEISPTDTLTIGFGVQYGQRAPSYTGLFLSEYDIEGALKGATLADGTTNADIQNISGFAEGADALFRAGDGTSLGVMGGVSLDLSEEVSLMVEGSYTQWDASYKAVSVEGTGTMVGTSLVWRPAAGLGIALTAGYSTYDFEGTDAGEDEGTADDVSFSSTKDSANIGTRIQYTF